MSANPTLDLALLFDSHRRELKRHVAKILKCEEAAADLVQESFLILSQTAEKQEIKQPRGFLFKVATHLAFNQLRRNKMMDSYVPILAQDEAETHSAEHVASQQQRLDRFIAIVNQMPPRRRDVYILHKVHGLSHKEIAKELGITVSGVEKHLIKGFEFLRLQLRNWDEG